MSAEVLLSIPYDQEMMARVRRVPGAHWDRERRVWVAPERPAVREAIEELGLRTRVVEFAPPRKPRVKEAGSEMGKRGGRRGGGGTPAMAKRAERAEPLPEEQQAAVQRMQEVLVRRQYAYSTRKTYVAAFRKFLPHFPNQDPGQITKRQIETYLLERVRDDGISESYQNTLINAIKFYYERVLDREGTRYDIARPIKREVMPKVLAREEVASMISLTQNRKHHCMLMLLYGGGLRLSEVLALVPTDIDSKRMTIAIRRSKGKKDRVVPLPQRLLAPLREYYREHSR